jgi:hypothetical protein
MDCQLGGQNYAWKVAPSVKLSFDQDGCVLLDTERGVFYGANGFASRLWSWIREARDDVTVNRLLEKAAAEAEASPDQVCRDIEEFLRDLESKGLLIRTVPAPG